MNADTGHLVNTAAQGDLELSLDQLKELGYDPLPAELELAAKAVLKGRKEAHVSLGPSGGKLSRYAAKRRKERRKRGRR
jgi:hypothetical protein